MEGHGAATASPRTWPRSERGSNSWGATSHGCNLTANPTRATLAATILGSSLAFVDGSVVNVALPALARQLHADPAKLSWAVTAYLLPLGTLILLGGGLGDHFGRRRVFLLGLMLFTGASILCAAAPTFAWLLTGRAAQGVGAALLMPNSLAILGGPSPARSAAVRSAPGLRSAR